MGKIWVGKSLSRGMNGKNGMVKETYLGMRLALMMKAQGSCFSISHLLQQSVPPLSRYPAEGLEVAITAASILLSCQHHQPEESSLQTALIFLLLIFSKQDFSV